MESKEKDDFLRILNIFKKEVHAGVKAKGWYDREVNDGEIIALIHSELSEALTALRNGNPTDKHCPEFSELEVELADVIMRIYDYAEYKNLRLGEAMFAKHKYNATRPYRHGGKKF